MKLALIISVLEPSIQPKRKERNITSPSPTNPCSSKKDTKSIIGPSGVREILSALASAGHGAIPTVCIGGVNGSNAGSVLTAARSPTKALDGVAVVSAIIAAPDPAAASRDLLSQVITAKIPEVVGAVASSTPLTHNMTNLVHPTLHGCV